MNYYLADLRDHANAAKRGGGKPTLALDALNAEERYRFEPVDRMTPDRIFENRWALTLLDAVFCRLEREFSDSSRAPLFQKVRPLLFDKDEATDYETLAVSLNMSAGSIRVAVHRIRKRCRELFREEVAQTVGNAAEVEEELRYLRQLMSE